MVRDQKGVLKLLAYLLRDMGRLLSRFEVGQDDGEFVASETGQRIAYTYARKQSLGYRF